MGNIISYINCLFNTRQEKNNSNMLIQLEEYSSDTDSYNSYLEYSSDTDSYPDYDLEEYSELIDSETES